SVTAGSFARRASRCSHLLDSPRSANLFGALGGVPGFLPSTVLLRDPSTSSLLGQLLLAASLVARRSWAPPPAGPQSGVASRPLDSPRDAPSRSGNQG